MKGIANDRQTPTPHQTGRTDFPYPAFRVASSQGIRFACLTSFPRMLAPAVATSRSGPAATRSGSRSTAPWCGPCLRHNHRLSRSRTQLLSFAEHPAALPVMEVSAPAPQQPVQSGHRFGYAPMQRPVVQFAPHGLRAAVAGFAALGFHMRIPSAAHSRGLPAHAETQEVKPFPAVHQPGLFFVEFEAARCQPAGEPFAQALPLSRCAQDDKVIGVAHQHRAGPALGGSLTAQSSALR